MLGLLDLYLNCHIIKNTKSTQTLRPSTFRNYQKKMCEEFLIYLIYSLVKPKGHGINYYLFKPKNIFNINEKNN